MRCEDRMKKYLKYVLTVALPLSGLTTLLGSCASTPCNNDACYDRSLSSVDPYEEGDVAAWGSEKYEKAKEKRLRQEKFNR
jgi:hypothetical protein